MYDKRTLLNIQAAGMDFILANGPFLNAEEMLLTEEYSILYAEKPRQSLVYVKTVMYPNDFSRYSVRECVNALTALCNERNMQAGKFELYFLGAGLMQKNAPEYEKGEFILGRKYLVALGDPVRLPQTDTPAGGKLPAPDFLAETRTLFKKNHIALGETDVKLYAGMFGSIFAVTNGKLTASEIFESFDILSDLILGKKPEYAVDVPEEERIKVQLRVMELLPQTAQRLTPEEKELYAFCVWYATCVRIFDEKTRTTVSGLRDCADAEKLRALYADEKTRRPSFFAGEKPEKLAADGDYGFTEENPVLLPSVGMSCAYMNSLRWQGCKVEYRRLGSKSDSRGRIIDVYRVRVPRNAPPSFKRGECTIFIHPYASEPVLKPPRGFTLKLD